MPANAVIKKVRAEMQKAFEHTLHQFSTLHTGKAHPSIVESVTVEAYGGTSMKLLECAAITTPDARSIRIEPWDKSILKSIEKAIQAANLGLNPIVDGHVVRCPIPELSKERRKDLAKVANTQAEDGRVGIRSARRDGMEALKKLQKDGAITEDDLKRNEKEVQKLTDDFTQKINSALKDKEAELIKV